MSNEQLPDWVQVGETAYLLIVRTVAGAGDVPTAHRVRITKVQARNVFAVRVSDGLTFRFRRDNLTVPGSGGRWSRDDRLVEPGHPEVRRAHRVAAVLSAVPRSDEWRAAMHKVERISPARIASDTASELAALVAALETIEAEAAASLAKLRAVRDARDAI